MSSLFFLCNWSCGHLTSVLRFPLRSVEDDSISVSELRQVRLDEKEQNALQKWEAALVDLEKEAEKFEQNKKKSTPAPSSGEGVNGRKAEEKKMEEDKFTPTTDRKKEEKRADDKKSSPVDEKKGGDEEKKDFKISQGSHGSSHHSRSKHVSRTRDDSDVAHTDKEKEDKKDEKEKERGKEKEKEKKAKVKRHGPMLEKRMSALQERLVELKAKEEEMKQRSSKSRSSGEPSS